ncbi:MAG: SIMPL domain-containing protein [Acidimicrobiia bacterium]
MARRMATTVCAALAATAALMVCTAPSVGAATATQRRITVVGTGQVKGTPDVADVSVGVSARAKTAGDALSIANDRASKVIGALKDAGVSGDDIQTSALLVQPTYSDDGDTILGYEVTNMVTARLRDLARTGDTLDKVARVAGDEIRVQGISFSIDDDSALLATARAKAVKRARAQAEQLAGAADVSLGHVISITEGAMSVPYDYRAADAAGTASSVPIEPGTQTLSIQTTVVFAID